MNEIRIETDRLTRDITEFENGMNRFSKSLSEMENNVNELNATWKGPAHEAFVQRFQKDMELMTEVWNILADMLVAIQYAKTSYQECDSEVLSVVSAINAAMPQSGGGSGGGGGQAF